MNFTHTNRNRAIPAHWNNSAFRKGLGIFWLSAHIVRLRNVMTLLPSSVVLVSSLPSGLRNLHATASLSPTSCFQHFCWVVLFCSLLVHFRCYMLLVSTHARPSLFDLFVTVTRHRWRCKLVSRHAMFARRFWRDVRNRLSKRSIPLPINTIEINTPQWRQRPKSLILYYLSPRRFLLINVCIVQIKAFHGWMTARHWRPNHRRVLSAKRAPLEVDQRRLLVESSVFHGLSLSISISR